VNLALLHPALLAGLALAGLPLLIHLISRRKATTVRFAAMEFVLRSTRRRARRIKLRQLLLLLLRTLLIAALALAVAGPHLVARDQISAAALPSQVVVCLDASASMQARSPTSDRSLFELARELAAERLRRLEATVPVAVFLAHRELTPLIEPASFDRAAVLRALEQGAVSNETSDLGECLVRAQALAPPPDRPGRAALLVVSDGAAHAWPEQGFSDGDLDLEVLRVPAAEAPRQDNRALTELRVVPSAMAPVGSYDVHFTLRRSSGVEERSPADVEVTLQID